MRYDSDIKALVSAAFYSEHDVFLRLTLSDINELDGSGVKTAVFLPGNFFGREELMFSDVNKELPSDAYMSERSFLVSDIRFLNNPLFKEYLSLCGFRRFVLIFAECADSGEYGYRKSCFNLSEIKSESESFIQLVAFFSPVKSELDSFTHFFGCENAVYAGQITETDIRVTEAPSQSAKFFRIASEAEKYAGKKVCIFFNSRSEARDFAVFLNNRGTPRAVIDGSVSYEDRKRILGEFERGEFQILLATKSIITETPFMKADKCLFCGVPFSESHLSRCSGLVKDGFVHIIFCKDDFVRNSRIIGSFSQITGDSSAYEKRMKSLSEIKVLLKEGQ